MLNKNDLNALEMQQEKVADLVRNIDHSVSDIRVSILNSISVRGKVENQAAQLLRIWKRIEELRLQNDLYKIELTNLEKKILDNNINASTFSISNMPLADKIFGAIIFIVSVITLIKVFAK